MHTPDCPRVGGLCYKYLEPNTYTFFGFIPLSVVLDIEAEEITWLILSAIPVFL